MNVWPASQSSLSGNKFDWKWCHPHFLWHLQFNGLISNKSYIPDLRAKINSLSSTCRQEITPILDSGQYANLMQKKLNLFLQTSPRWFAYVSSDLGGVCPCKYLRVFPQIAIVQYLTEMGWHLAIYDYGNILYSSYLQHECYVTVEICTNVLPTFGLKSGHGKCNFLWFLGRNICIFDCATDQIPSLIVKKISLDFQCIKMKRPHHFEQGDLWLRYLRITY